MESIFSFQRPGVGVNILCGAVEAVIFFAVLWVLEVRGLTDCYMGSWVAISVLSSG